MGIQEAVDQYIPVQKNQRDLRWGVDLNMFPFVDRESKGEVVTLDFAKRLHVLSGPDILLKSFQYAHDRFDRKLLLKIAGDGPMKTQVRIRAQRTRLWVNP